MASISWILARKTNNPEEENQYSVAHLEQLQQRAAEEIWSCQESQDLLCGSAGQIITTWKKPNLSIRQF